MKTISPSLAQHIYVRGGVHDVFQCLEFHTLYECHINERKMMHVKLFLFFSVVVHSVFRIVEKVVFSDAQIIVILLMEMFYFMTFLYAIHKYNIFFSSFIHSLNLL